MHKNGRWTAMLGYRLNLISGKEFQNISVLYAE
jgi:hypothetical protein